MSAVARYVFPCTNCGTRNAIPASRRYDNPRCGHCHQPLFNDKVVHVSDADFAATVEASPLPVLVDFWAPWCGPCLSMNPTLSTLATDRAGRLLVVKINIDESPALASRFSIRAIPALKLFVTGELIDGLNGLSSKSQLDAFLNGHSV